MNRKLLTGLTLASVAGTGGAAYASVAGAADTTPPSASTATIAVPPAASTTVPTPASTAASAIVPVAAAVPATTAVAPDRTISYQVGDAGTVTVDVAGGAMTSSGLVPASGWNIGAMSNTGSHLEVQFASTERVVGFSADLVGGDVVVSVTNDRLPGGSGPLDPVTVSMVSGAGGGHATLPAPAPAVVPPTAPVVPATPPTTPVTTSAPVAPPAASTTAPSSVGTNGSTGDDNGEHEVGNAGHGSDSEGGEDD